MLLNSFQKKRCILLPCDWKIIPVLLILFYSLSSALAQEDELQIEITPQTSSHLNWITKSLSSSKNSTLPFYFIPLKGSLNFPHLSVIMTQIDEHITFERILPENEIFTTPEIPIQQKKTPFEMTLIDYEGNIFKENYTLHVLNWDVLTEDPSKRNQNLLPPQLSSSEDLLFKWSLGLGYSSLHYEQLSTLIQPVKIHRPAMTLTVLRQQPILVHQLYAFAKAQISSVHLSEEFFQNSLQILDLELGADYYLKKPSLDSSSLKLRTHLLYSTTFSSQKLGYTNLPGLSFGLGFERPLTKPVTLLLGGGFSFLYNGKKIESPTHGRLQIFTGIAFHPQEHQKRTLLKLEYTHQNVDLQYSPPSLASSPAPPSSLTQLNSKLQHLLLSVQFEF